MQAGGLRTARAHDSGGVAGTRLAGERSVRRQHMPKVFVAGPGNLMPAPAPASWCGTGSVEFDRIRRPSRRRDGRAQTRGWAPPSDHAVASPPVRPCTVEPSVGRRVRDPGGPSSAQAQRPARRRVRWQTGWRQPMPASASGRPRPSAKARLTAASLVTSVWGRHLQRAGSCRCAGEGRWKGERGAPAGIRAAPARPVRPRRRGS